MIKIRSLTYKKFVKVNFYKYISQKNKNYK